MQDFFFDALKENDTELHNNEYGYISPCWGEANFVKVFGAPIVFRHMEKNDEDDSYMMNYAGTMSEVFDPKKLFMNKDGLLLHEIESHKSLKVGSFDTNLACELAENLSERNCEKTGEPTHYFEWDGQEYRLEERPELSKY